MNRFGSLMVSAIILALYAAHALHPVVWSEGDTKLMDTCLTLVMGYWLGSSSGSAAKNDLLVNSTPTGR